MFFRFLFFQWEFSPLLKQSFEMLFSDTQEVADAAKDVIVATVQLAARKSQQQLREILYPMIFSLQDVSKLRSLLCSLHLQASMRCDILYTSALFFRPSLCRPVYCSFCLNLLATVWFASGRLLCEA